MSLLPHAGRHGLKERPSPVSETAAGAMETEGMELLVRGIVQGVGFRPHVYRLALRNGLSGTVANTGEGVLIRAGGRPASLDAFARALVEEAPPLARITSVERRPAAVPDSGEFVISASSPGMERAALISPDVAVCEDCKRELLDPADRRSGYPFTNCTNCGPRFTIIRSIPYDRPRTSMKAFEMCPRCAGEYHDPMDRRFHAQPNACRVCGPGLEWCAAGGEPVPGADPVAEAARAVRDGRVVAIRGLGGFHLAVDARSQTAVALLRSRKRRRAKPLAVMVRDAQTARRLCALSSEEEALLVSPQRPIVLLERRAEADLAPDLAPGLRDLGVMLPYTPLHHLLFARPEAPDALVMTSGNVSDEPICTGNREALERLSGIADFFLLHNRDILARVDDSVAKVIAGRPRILRRSRGYVPGPTALAWDLPRILACGAEIKNTFCLCRGRQAFLSQHIGDLNTPQTLEFFTESVDHLKALLEIEPEATACDLHPDYLSTRYAATLGLPAVTVQHHHAHAAAVMAEHDLKDSVLAVILDGTGYGPDGTVWGGEVLLANRLGYQRLGHLGHLMLPGGDAAAREPWRMAVAALWSAFGPDAVLGEAAPGALMEIPLEKRRVLVQMLSAGLNSPRTSSCGRLFDAVAAILGLRLVADYEGQAAMELETLAWQAAGGMSPWLTEEFRRPAYRSVIVDRGACCTLDTGNLIRDLVKDISAGVPSGLIALRFHHWLVGSLSLLARRMSAETGVRQVVLGGGCMQNAMLLEGLVNVLSGSGLSVYSGEDVPVNDGGIALGQAVIGGRSHVLGHTHARH